MRDGEYPQPMPVGTKVIITTNDSGWARWGKGDYGYVISTPIDSKFVWVKKDGDDDLYADPFALRELVIVENKDSVRGIRASVVHI